MGVIYSSIDVATTAIPETESHERAAREIMSRLPELGGTVLTLVHGSVAEGRSNIRSDLDVLVTYKFDAPQDEPIILDGIKAVFEQVSSQTFVRPEFNIWPAHEPVAARRERMQDILFNKHLAASMLNPKWSVGDSDATISELASLEYDDQAMVRIMLNYATHKHTGFAKAPREYSDEDKTSQTAMQRALELPNALKRKISQFADIIGYDEDQLYRPSELLGDNLNKLAKIDAEYTDLVEFTTLYGENVAQSMLDDYLAWLKDRYVQALRLGTVTSSGFIAVISSIN